VDRKISIEPGDSGVNCLKVVDLNADTIDGKRRESGVGLRKRIKPGEDLYFYGYNAGTTTVGGTLTITFSNGSPFGASTLTGNPVKFTKATTTQGRYKYDIKLVDAGGVVYKEDPQIIVDGSISSLPPKQEEKV
jgi:hypothetical protein